MITEIIITALLLIAGTFALVGSYGLVKLPDLMTRLHAPTKASTLGVGGVLIASMGYAALTSGARPAILAHFHGDALRVEIVPRASQNVWT